VQCGLIKQVNSVREPSRYCPNLHEHAHFHDEATGEIHDVDIPADLIARLHNLLPKGYDAVSIDLSFRGSVRALHALTDQQN
jgi:Fur family peroxide stress response transcriptional regulator